MLFSTPSFRRPFDHSCFRFRPESNLYLLAFVSYVLSNVRIPHGILIAAQGLNSLNSFKALLFRPICVEAR